MATFEEDRAACRAKRRLNIEEAIMECAREWDRLRYYHCPLCFSYHLSSRLEDKRDAQEG